MTKIEFYLTKKKTNQIKSETYLPSPTSLIILFSYFLLCYFFASPFVLFLFYSLRFFALFIFVVFFLSFIAAHFSLAVVSVISKLRFAKIYVCLCTMYYINYHSEYILYCRYFTAVAIIIILVFVVVAVVIRYMLRGSLMVVLLSRLIIHLHQISCK